MLTLRKNGLFRLFVFGVLSAERAIFAQNESVRIVFLVLNRVVISLLAFRTFKRDFRSSGFSFTCHNQKTPYKKLHPSWVRAIKFITLSRGCQSFFALFLIFFTFLQNYFFARFLALSPSLFFYYAYAKDLRVPGK